MFVDFSKYSGFIFDLDGTLIDSMPYHIGAWQQVCREHGYEISADFIYERGGFSSRNIVLDIKKAGHDVGDVDAFVRRKIELYRHNLEKVPLFPKVYQIALDAKARGAKVCIGTGTQRINAQDSVRQHNMTDIVDLIVSSDDVQKHKPDPQTYIKCMEFMGLTPEQCLVIEDGIPGIKAAAAAHMDCLIVNNDEFVELVKG